jgi:hypothetical protein
MASLVSEFRNFEALMHDDFDWPPKYVGGNIVYIYIVRSESRCAIIKCVGSYVHERWYSKNWIKQFHTLPVLHFNRYLTEYSETTAHFNGNFATDNQVYVP